MSLNTWFEEWSAAQIQHLVEAPSEMTTLLQAEEKRHLEFMENQARMQQESTKETEHAIQLANDALWFGFGIDYSKIDFVRLREENEQLKRERMEWLTQSAASQKAPKRSRRRKSKKTALVKLLASAKQ